MILFAASAVVAVLCVVFNKIQITSYTKEYQQRLEDDTSRAQIPFGLSPIVIKSWFDRGLDTAANFPAYVLMLIAFSETQYFRNGFAVAILIIAAVGGTLAMLVRIGPTYAGSFAPFGISLWTLGIIVLSLIGLGIEIWVWCHSH